MYPSRHYFGHTRYSLKLLLGHMCPRRHDMIKKALSYFPSIADVKESNLKVIPKIIFSLINSKSNK